MNGGSSWKEPELWVAFYKLVLTPICFAMSQYFPFEDLSFSTWQWALWTKKPQLNFLLPYSLLLDSSDGWWSWSLSLWVGQQPQSELFRATWAMVRQDIWDSNVHSKLLGQKLIKVPSLKIILENILPRTSLVVQRLKYPLPMQGSDSVPAKRARSHRLEPKILHVCWDPAQPNNT